jgi:hypothetical protein
MTLSNYWLGRLCTKDDLKKLDDYLMEAWSNDATVDEVLSNMPNEIKCFFLQLKIGCPNPAKDGIQITIDI